MERNSDALTAHDRRAEAIARTRQRCMEQGIKLGRRKGTVLPKKLDGHKNTIRQMFLDGRNKKYICQRLDVTQGTLNRYLESIGWTEYTCKGRKKQAFEVLEQYRDYIELCVRKGFVKNLASEFGISNYYLKKYCKEMGINGKT